MATQIKLSIPTDWSEITTKQYMDYIASVKDTDTNEDNMAKLLLYFCGIKGNVVKHFKVKDLIKIQDVLSRLISKPINTDIMNKIELDGVRYGFHPNLDELTFGEFIDLDTYAKEHNLAKMLGVLYRPIVEEQGNRYTIESYSFDIHGKNYIKLQSLSINIANAVAVFFWDLGRELLNDSRISLSQKEKKVHQQITAGLPL